MILRRQSKSSKAVLIKQCDDIFREIIRRRDKVCQRTWVDRNLQVAHFISRENKHLRWTKDNAVLLNGGVHKFWAHKNHSEFRDFMISRIGEEKVKKFEMMDKVHCRPLYECEIRLIRKELLKEAHV
jgi:hypothetical protein